MLIYGRNQHAIVIIIQLKIKKEKRIYEEITFYKNFKQFAE